MAKKDSDNQKQATFEAQMEELESLIERIESGEIGLEDSIKAYERGVDLIKYCRGVLGQAEQRVEELSRKLQDDSAGEDDA